MLDRSERPAFVVGYGVDRNDAWDEVVALAERHQALVWVSPMSSRCSFPERHPLFAGFLPPMREQIVKILDGHDLIVALGAPVFTYHIEGFGPHIPPGASLVQIIDDPNVAAWTPLGTALVCNVRLGVQAILRRPTSSLYQPKRSPLAPAPQADRAASSHRRRGPDDRVPDADAGRRPPRRQHHRRGIAVEPEDDAGASAD